MENTDNPITDMPTWKFVGMLFGILFAGACVMALFTTGMMALEDKYEQTPSIIVDAGYKNTTTIWVVFDDFWSSFHVNHFPVTATKVDRVDIRIDSNLVDTITGAELTTDLYYYTVDSSRHDVVVDIHYKNGETKQETFSNAWLEG